MIRSGQTVTRCHTNIIEYVLSQGMVLYVPYVEIKSFESSLHQFLAVVHRSVALLDIEETTRKRAGFEYSVN